MMSWASVSAAEALERLKRGARGLDVRSEGEFAEGLLPGFVNIPILNNEHRHLVGLTYKLKGQAAAVSLGMDLVTPGRTELLARWREFILADSISLSPRSSQDPIELPLLICWRGGLRSKMAAQWMADAELLGLRVDGGYKAIRRELLSTYQHLPKFLVLAGLTGVGKTTLLESLPTSGVLDLEKLANHRGSSFGLRPNSQQPTQQSFENNLGFELWRSAPLRVVEAESRLIGYCCIPSEVKGAMDLSPLVMLEVPQEDRVRNIYREYVEEPCARLPAEVVFDHLLSSLKRVEKKLGGLRFALIAAELAAAFATGAADYQPSLERHWNWIESLLRDYYDPLYLHSLRKNDRRVIFSGDFKAVRDYFLNEISHNGTMT